MTYIEGSQVGPTLGHSLIHGHRDRVYEAEVCVEACFTFGKDIGFRVHSSDFKTLTILLYLCSLNINSNVDFFSSAREH